MKARTAAEKGEKSVLSDPGSELCLGGEKQREKEGEKKGAKVISNEVSKAKRNKTKRALPNIENFKPNASEKH